MEGPPTLFSSLLMRVLFLLYYVNELVQEKRERVRVKILFWSLSLEGLSSQPFNSGKMKKRAIEAVEAMRDRVK